MHMYVFMSPTCKHSLSGRQGAHKVCSWQHTHADRHTRRHTQTHSQIHTQTHACTHTRTHTHRHTHTPHRPNTLWPNTAPCQNYSTERLNMEHTPTLPQRYNTQTRPSTCGAQNSLCVCIDLFHCGPLSLCVHVFVFAHAHTRVCVSMGTHVTK